MRQRDKIISLSGEIPDLFIGDTRRHKHFVPITLGVLQSFLDVGFVLREDVIKLQWKRRA